MNTIIHIGPPRTATTLLQKQLFDKHPRIMYMGYHRTKRIDPLGRSTMVISDEYIVTKAGASRSWREMFADLKDAFKEGQILFSLRNQIDVIPSQYVASTFYKSRTLDEAISRADLFYDYNNIYNTACEYFGKVNVHFIFFENLINEFETYTSQLNEILGINDSAEFLNNKQENKRKSGLRKSLEDLPGPGKKVLPRFLRRYISGLADRFGKSAKVELSENQITGIKNKFAEPNRQFAKATGTEDILNKFGYPL